MRIYGLPMRNFARQVSKYLSSTIGRIKGGIHDGREFGASALLSCR